MGLDAEDLGGPATNSANMSEDYLRTKNVVKCYERIDTLCNGFSLPLNLIVDCSRLIELLESTFELYGNAPEKWEEEQENDPQSAESVQS